MSWLRQVSQRRRHASNSTTLSGVWSPEAPSWDEMRELGAPLFVGPPGLRQVALHSMCRAILRPITSLRLLGASRSPRQVLSLMSWLDTGRFLNVGDLCWPDGTSVARMRRLRRTEARRMTFGAEIGVAMIVLNEAEHVMTAIDSVRRIANELVVLDGGSTDGTPDILRSAGVRVLRHEFDIQDGRDADFAAQRNRAQEALTTDWILRIDADEALQPALADQLQAASLERDVDVVFVPRLNLIGDPCETPEFWPSIVPVLFRRHLRFRGRIHEELVGWSRPLLLPLSGPYMLHSKSLLSYYKSGLRYALLDPESYAEDWLEMARGQVARLEKLQD